MLVQQILASKSSEAVLTISPSASVSEAAAILSQKKIGCLVVSADGHRPDGILSERDIVREIGRRGSSCLVEPVSALMTKGVVTCGRGETADQVLQTMTDGRFRHLPVVEGGKLVGLISIGDVVKARLAELAMEKDALEGMIKGF
jgi:CBS domain-containing protein